MRFLLFTLYAPLAAMGEIAPGERRMGYARPTRSGMLGMIAAAFGWKREDRDHAELDRSVNFAVRTHIPGLPFTDYHTAQSPQHRKNLAFSTRRAEVQADDLNTVLSVREWRSDALYTIALWPRPSASVGLDAIGDSLNQPQFTLYLGRKAGVLGLPLSPRIAEADTLDAAFANDPLEKARKDLVENVKRACRWRTRNRDVETAFDIDAGVTPPQHTIEMRRDAPGDRLRHQFEERREGVTRMKEEDGP